MTIEDAALKRAIEWMSDRLREEPNAKRAELIDQASREFGKPAWRKAYYPPGNQLDVVPLSKNQLLGFNPTDLARDLSAFRSVHSGGRVRPPSRSTLSSAR